MSFEKYDLEINKPHFIIGQLWKLKELTPITIIFGKNSSGKSVLLRTLRDKDPLSYHYCVPERGGNINYEAGMVQQEADGKARVAGSKQNLGADYRTRVISRIGSYLEKRGASRETISGEEINMIEELINQVQSDFRFSIESGYPPYNLVRIDTGEKIENIQNLSSGEAQLLTLTLDLILACEMWRLDNKSGYLLIDEPDSHLHPDMQHRFAKFIVKLQEKYDCKIIASTHSTTLLSALGQSGDNKTSVIYLTNNDELHANQFSKVLKTLSTCLGGHALMGPLFNAPIFLVEGDDDYRIWSEIPRHHSVEIAVIPCNGTEIFEYQKALEQLFSSIIEKSDKPSGYALLDGDKTIPQVKQDHIKFLKLACHESENLYLTDEVLKELGCDWSSACTKVIAQSGSYGEKSSELSKIGSLERKTADCKNVINQIARILDEKNLHWAYRIGKILGQNKPSGTIADFLGEEIVNSLWK